MRFNKAFECVLQTQKVRTQRMKRTYDANVKYRQNAVGELVYYHYPRTSPGRTATWTRFCTDPFKILKAVNEVNYFITKSPKSKPFIFHGDKLKLHQCDIPAIWAGIKTNLQIFQQ
jgi:hypothetical protein